MSRSVAARRGWDRRRENEERVTVNIAPDLMPLWERVRWGLKGTPQERLEAFEAYVHDHPSEVTQALQDAADAKLHAELDEADARAEEETEHDTAPFEDPLLAEYGKLRATHEATVARLAAAEDVIARLHGFASALTAEVEYLKGQGR